MKRITHFKVFYALLCLCAFCLWTTSSRAQSSLSTYPTTMSNNGTQGVSFELTTVQTILLQSLDAALFSTGSSTFDIYYRVGGVQHTPGSPPNITAANGWTLLGSTSATGTAGVPTPVPLALNLLLTPGTYGIYMNTSNMGYKTWVTGSTDVFTDGIVTLETGQNKGYGGPAPNPGFHPRQFVGTVHYLPIASAPDDAGVASIDAPVASCEGTYDVLVTIQNYGKDQLNSVVINWEVDGTPQTPVFYSQLIDTLFGQFPSTAQVMLGTMSLSAGTPSDLLVYTSDPNNKNDTVNYNDTVAINYTNVVPTVNTFPYIEDFENGQADWNSSGSNSSWAFGTPAKPNINSASSGINAWVTGGLTGQYNANEDSRVASPCFDMSNFEGEAWIALDVQWWSEFSWDGTAVQYSDDGGNNWNTIGAFGDPYNWYNDNSISGNPGGQQDGWTGTGTNSSQGWVRAKHKVDQSVVGKPGVRFRVAFGSDGSVLDEGFAFDNFIVTDYKPANLGPDQVSLCGEPSIVLDPNVNYPGKIEWSTGDTTSPTITVSLEDIYWVMFTDSLLDLISGDTVEIIDTDPPQINFVKSIDTVSVFSYVTLDPRLSFDHNFEWTPPGVNYPYLLVKGSEYGVGTHTFNLKVTDSVNCTDQAVAIVRFVDYTGIDGVESGQLTFYPNPAREQITVNLENVPADEISIYSMTGQVVSSKLMTKSQSRVVMDLNSLKSGMYMLVVRVGEDRITHKFVKE